MNCIQRFSGLKKKQGGLSLIIFIFLLVTSEGVANAQDKAPILKELSNRTIPTNEKMDGAYFVKSEDGNTPTLKLSENEHTEKVVFDSNGIEKSRKKYGTLKNNNEKFETFSPSPDGKEIIFTNSFESVDDMRLVDVDGNLIKDLTAIDKVLGTPFFSKTGALFVVLNEGIGFEVYNNSGTLLCKNNSFNSEFANVCFSPDEKLIGINPHYKGNFIVITPDCQTKFEYSLQKLVGGECTFSNDGSLVAFVSSRKIFVIKSADGSKVDEISLPDIAQGKIKIGFFDNNKLGIIDPRNVWIKPLGEGSSLKLLMNFKSYGLTNAEIFDKYVLIGSGNQSSGKVVLLDQDGTIVASQEMPSRPMEIGHLGNFIKVLGVGYFKLLKLE